MGCDVDDSDVPKPSECGIEMVEKLCKFQSIHCLGLDVIKREKFASFLTGWKIIILKCYRRPQLIRKDISVNASNDKMCALIFLICLQKC